MATPEHIEIVKRGKEAIAAWRKEHPFKNLDLVGADLVGADTGWLTGSKSPWKTRGTKTHYGC